MDRHLVMQTISTPRFWLVLIVAIGGLLRAAHLLEIEHNIDRAYPLWQALMTLEHGVFPTTGQGTSVLFANPPLMGYLLLPFVALTRTPLGAYGFVIVLNTLGIVFTYKASRLIASPQVALFAAFLMAVNPWMIEYNRLTWVQGLLPFLAPALAWALWSVLLGQAAHPGRRLLLALLLLTVAAQTYLLAFALTASVALTLIVRTIWRPRLRWTPSMRRALIGGAAVFASAAALYGAGLLAENERTAGQIAQFSERPARLSAEALTHAVRLVSGQDYAISRGQEAPIRDWALRQAWSEAAHWVIAAAMVVGVARAIWQVRWGDRAGLLPLIWFAVPVLMMSYVGQLVHPFYQLLSIPAGAALAGIGLEAAAFGWGGHRARALRWAIVLAAAISFGVLSAINSLRYAEETAALPGAHGLAALPLGDGLALGAAIRDHLPPGGTVYADLDPFTLPSMAGMTFDFIADARSPALRVFPQRGGLYIDMSSISEPSDPTLIVQPLADGTAIRLRLLPAGPARTDRFQVTAVHGVRPIDYALTETAEGWELKTVWQIDDPLPDDAGTHLFAPFAHVFDAAGNRVLIVDGAAVPGYNWRPGDVQEQIMKFALPEGSQPPYRIAIGQYDAVRAENAIFITPVGSYTPTVDLPEEVG